MNNLALVEETNLTLPLAVDSDTLAVLQNLHTGDIQKNIDAAEKHFLSGENSPCPVQHHFGPNLYLRELNIKAGSFAIGQYQKTEHLNIFVRGRVLMLDQDTGEYVVKQAPMLFTSPPGRKVGYILEDMTWINVYSTSERDIETLESMFLEPNLSMEEYNQIHACISVHDREDYESLLENIGITNDDVEREMANLEHKPFPVGSFSVKISDSNIHGKGLFATADFKKGALICPSILNGNRTPAARYTNHAKFPNARPIIINGDMHLVATSDICGCRGGIKGDEVTIDYRDAIKLRKKE